MDTGLMLNMLGGTAAVNSPAAGGIFNIAASNVATSSNASGHKFPTMVSAMSAQISSNPAGTPSAPFPVINMGEFMQSLSVTGSGKGVMHPAGAENILVQGNILIDPEAMQNILASNKALANKLDGLIANGDAESFASIMKNITAIVKQINTGQFDLSNLDSILGQTGVITPEVASSLTPASEHSLMAINAAASFEPIVNVQLDNTPTLKGELLPHDILSELANLGQSPLAGTSTANGQSAQTPIAAAMAAAANSSNIITPSTPVVNATEQSVSKTPVVKNSVIAAAANSKNVTPPSTQGVQQTSPQTTRQVVNTGSSAVVSSEASIVNKHDQNPVVNLSDTEIKGLVGNGVQGLATAAAATVKATTGNVVNSTQNADSQTQVEGSALPHQAAPIAQQKNQVQSASLAQVKVAPSPAPQNVETPTQSGNGQSGSNTQQGENQQSQSGPSGHNNSGGNPSNNGQQQSMQDSNTQQQADIKSQHNSTPFTAQSTAPTNAESPSGKSKIFAPEFTSEQTISPSETKSSQVTLVPKTFGGTITKGLVKDVANQVGMEVSRQAKAGNTEFTVRLNPEELGKVTIKMAFDKDGSTSLRILAQSPETLALLQRDVGGLERAIEAGGLKSEQSNISLELDNQHNGQSAGKAMTEAALAEKAQENKDKAAALVENAAEEALDANETTPLEQILAQLDSENGLDIRI